MSTKKENIPGTNSKSEEEFPNQEIGEQAIKKGTFIGANGREIEFTEDKNGVVEFVSSNGIKVVITHPPSKEACEAFVRALLSVRLKSILKKDKKKSN